MVNPTKNTSASDLTIYQDQMKGMNREFVEMVRAGQLNVAGMITHRYDRRDAPEAFELLTSDRAHEAVGVVFAYD